MGLKLYSLIKWPLEALGASEGLQQKRIGKRCQDVDEEAQFSAVSSSQARVACRKSSKCDLSHGQNYL